jgi:glycosyltransferase involved in cell wall biosynthesis
MVRFSILMPVYNREKYVRQAVDSVLAQTFTDYEIFAIDDGSTDESAKVLKSFGNRIKLIQQRNQGPEVARNAGAALAQGEYLVLLDSDDFLFPSTLGIYDRIIRTFDSPPLILGSDIFYRDGQIIPAESLLPNPVEVLKFQDYLSKTIPLTTPNSKIVIKKSVFDEIGGLRNTTPLTFHNDDLHLLLKVGTYGPCVVVRKPYTLAYRMHQENSIRNVKLIAEGVLSLARSERLGEYPGGGERRWDRYSVLGGRASTWAFRYCWKGGQKKLALRLLSKTAPMVFAALWNKSLRSFRKSATPIVLPE